MPLGKVYSGGQGLDRALSRNKSKSKEIEEVVESVAKTEITSTSTMAKKVKIAIIYYTTYGHVKAMADKVKEGVDSVDGCEGVLYQVPETLPEEVLKKMGAPPKPSDPVITHDKLDELVNADGVLFGIPTRFGMMSAQMKAFFDSTGGLWFAGKLVGKPAGIFFSTGSQGGGQETTALTAVTQLAHHGMIYVSTGFAFSPEMFNYKEVHGGSAYGAGTIAGSDGSRQPSEYELKYAFYQGSYMATTVKKFTS
mmetsp:Transcript_5980/g.10627  ORF Transcript_5980/g.10627 Transcript_5980/m.10627 type:complete len:252 (-) Transcript_5980:318-1073(-)